MYELVQCCYLPGIEPDNFETELFWPCSHYPIPYHSFQRCSIEPIWLCQFLSTLVHHVVWSTYRMMWGPKISKLPARLSTFISHSGAWNKSQSRPLYAMVFPSRSHLQTTTLRIVVACYGLLWFVVALWTPQCFLKFCLDWRRLSARISARTRSVLTSTFGTVLGVRAWAYGRGEDDGETFGWKPW